MTFKQKVRLAWTVTPHMPGATYADTWRGRYIIRQTRRHVIALLNTQILGVHTGVEEAKRDCEHHFHLRREG